ncbi:MAG: hypothetical protein AAF386_06965, partial [Pseudomonadota bacterium]
FAVLGLICPMLTFAYYLICHRIWRRSVGKWITGQVLSGDGCLACRELQKLWPVLIVFASVSLTQTGLSSAHPIVSSIAYLLFLAGPICLIFQVTCAFNVQVPYWDKSTGFQVMKAH